MGYGLNCLDEPVFIAVSDPLLTEFGIQFIIHWRAVAGKNIAHLPSPKYIDFHFIIGGLG